MLFDNLPKDYEKEWVDMPEYNNVNEPDPFITATYKFRNEADYLKFKELAKDAEFTTEESFKEKLETLKESYFPKKKVVSESVDSESENSEVESKEVSGSMASYLAAITKTKK